MPQSTYSLSFLDVSADYVDLGSGIAAALNGSFTLSFWAKLSTPSGPATVLFGAWAQTNPRQITYNQNGTGVCCEDGGTRVLIQSGSNLSAGWHHICWTYDGGTNDHILYLDGSSAGTTNRGFGGTYSGNYYLSRHNGNEQNTWQVDDVAVIGSVLTSGQVAGIAAGSTDVSTLSPVGLWRLEEGSGTSTDETGSGGFADATLHGTTAWSSDVPGPLAGGSSPTGSGALSIDATTLAGTGTTTSLVTGSGALAAQAATVAGSGTTTSAVAGSGSPAATAAVLAGTGTHTPPPLSGSGDLAVAESVLAGTGVYTPPGVSGSGALAVQETTVAGVGHTDAYGTGALACDVAVLAGTGVCLNPGGNAQRKIRYGAPGVHKRRPKPGQQL